MKLDGNIYLGGFMGCGKSTIGPLLAQHLQRPFVDLDAAIEKQSARSISDLFACKGEPYFRALEAKTLRLLVNEHNNKQQIVALGGGTLIDEANINLIKRTGVSIYLDVDQSYLHERLSSNGKLRPLLDGSSGESFAQLLNDLFITRLSGYLQCDLRISCLDYTPTTISELIIKRLEQCKP